ncbi:MAG TPA: hypothetical protein VK874_08945 [Gaiellaceae bacterium]|nr:hypothetical protein [Gaiellaceae bacterium]
MPDWTDHPDSDPGLTLMALFAWLALALLFGLAFHAYLRRRSADRRDPQPFG